MNFKYLPTSVLVVWLLFAASIRAEENPMNDPDLQQLLKQAQEMQKSSRFAGCPEKTCRDGSDGKTGSGATRAGGKGREGKITGRAKEAARCARPSRVPDWTPVTPEFKPAGKPAKKVVDEEVKIVQTGTSSLTPEKIAETWQAAATAANNLNQSLNKMNVNGKSTRILLLSTRTDPRQEVELEASREPDSKITQVEISSPLPKPDVGNE